MGKSKNKESKFKRIKSSRFLGRQLSRLKMGQSYYSILMQSIMAISILRLAFPTIEFIYMVMLFPFFLSLAYLIGLYLDRHNIITADIMKSNEVSHRYLNTSDKKNQEFQSINTAHTIAALNANAKGEIYDFKLYEQDLSEYKKKWSAQI